MEAAREFGGFHGMSAEAVGTAVGEDGIRIAVDALKDLAQNAGESGVRLGAASTLLQYGLAYVDAFGNAVAG